MSQANTKCSELSCSVTNELRTEVATLKRQNNTEESASSSICTGKHKIKEAKFLRHKQTQNEA